MKISLSLLLVFCLILTVAVAVVAQITGSTLLSVVSPNSLLSGCTVNESNNTPTCATPSGWTFAGAEGFGGGVLHLNAVTPPSNTITKTKPHSGSYSLQGTYSASGQAVALFIRNTILGASTEVYVSWWDYKDANGRMNDEMFIFRPFIGDANGNLLEENVFDYYGFGSRTNSGFNAIGGTIIDSNQGQNGVSYNGGPGRTINWGSWEQYEVHYKPNTVGNSNGEFEIYVNGQLLWQKLNVNITTVSMVGMGMEIGGVYTKLTWYHSLNPNVCGQWIGDGNTSGPGAPGGSFNSLPCPNQGPPNPPGVVPTFNRYIDDIIVLKK